MSLNINNGSFYLVQAWEHFTRARLSWGSRFMASRTHQGSITAFGVSKKRGGGEVFLLKHTPSIWRTLEIDIVHFGLPCFNCSNSVKEDDYLLLTWFNWSFLTTQPSLCGTNGVLLNQSLNKCAERVAKCSRNFCLPLTFCISLQLHCFLCNFQKLKA